MASESVSTATLVVAAALLILAKLLKWGLELLVWLVLIGGAVLWAGFAAQFEIDRFVVAPAQALAGAGVASAIALVAVALAESVNGLLNPVPSSGPKIP